ncbi:MAG: DUF420 domain-containing protein [Thaumarchaeota archaeon]|nr:DUF420 domain-containing protein [Candidatus Calditenuaceae archaeon]MDW8187626.1 DUF420 domain-containing protein [Nitrososphaerota archaeon]
MVSVRRHTALTAIVTLVAYTVLSYLLLSPRESVEVGWAVEVLPHAIAAVNLTGLISLQLGYRAIKRGDVRSHKLFMLASFLLITAFLVMYVSRLFLGGVEVYRGPEILRNFVYLPILAIHLALSIISVPLVFFNVLTGGTIPIAYIAQTPHLKVGKIAYATWSVSLALGVVVYLFLRFLNVPEH